MRAGEKITSSRSARTLSAVRWMAHLEDRRKCTICTAKAPCCLEWSASICSETFAGKRFGAATDPVCYRRRMKQPLTATPLRDRTRRKSHGRMRHNGSGSDNFSSQKHVVAQQHGKQEKSLGWYARPGHIVGQRVPPILPMASETATLLPGAAQVGDDEVSRHRRTP